MTKLIWMTDPHFQNTGTIDGLDPRLRLKAAITHANAHYPDAEFALLTGDLVGDDIDGDYTALAGYLESSALPIHPMMGNNDDRAGFRARLSLPQDAMPDFVQFALDTAEGRILCLDTHKVGSAAGQFCDARMDWLEGQLTDAGDTPVYIFMHHPPMSLGLPKQDEIMLDEGAAFLDLLTAHASVKHLFMGHVHRPTCGSIRGIPFATLGALSFQAPAPRPAWDWDNFKAAAEPPHYAVVEIAQGNVTVQFIQFCDAQFGLSG
ncbi:MAG: metallophosphoesterase [Rhodobacteraceae bacterium]|nr:metallophosphoesterase [Paracoccaceae bacterium]